MKRIIAVLLAACLLILSGCSGRDEEIKPAPENPAVYDPSSPVTITLAEYAANPERSQALRLIADKYQYDHPNVKIEIVDMPEDAEEAQGLLKQDGIDIFEVDDQTGTWFIKNGQAADIAKYIDLWDENYTLTISARWITYYYSLQEAYFIPSTISQKAMYYRKDLLEEYGDRTENELKEIIIPRFFETIYNISQRVMEAGAVDYGLLLPLGEKDRSVIADYIMWSHVGLENIANRSAAYFQEDESDKTIFSLPQTESALEYMKSVYDNLGPKEAIDWDDEDLAKQFSQGKAFAIIADSKAIPIIESGPLEDDQWVVYSLPLGGERQSGIGVLENEYTGWAINSDSEKQEVAAAFLLYLSNSDNSTYLAKMLGDVPIHSDAIELDNYYSDSHFSGFQMQASRAANGQYHFDQPPRSYDAYGYDYFEKTDEMYKRFLTGELEAKTLMGELDAYWISAFDAEGQLWKSAAPKENSGA